MNEYNKYVVLTDTTRNAAHTNVSMWRLLLDVNHPMLNEVTEKFPIQAYLNLALDEPLPRTPNPINCLVTPTQKLHDVPVTHVLTKMVDDWSLVEVDDSKGLILKVERRLANSPDDMLRVDWDSSRLARMLARETHDGDIKLNNLLYYKLSLIFFGKDAPVHEDVI